MKRILSSVVLILIVLLLLSVPVLAADGLPFNPDALCLPGVYLQVPDNCNPAGPSTYLTNMAEKGITFPYLPLAYTRPDPALTHLDIHYGLVRTEKAPVYSSVDDALRAKKNAASYFIIGDFVYITYTDETIVDGKRFYMVESGAWMTANDVTRIGALPLFQGVTLSATPRTNLAWIINYFSPDPIMTKRTPGDAVQDYTTHGLKNLEVVPVFAVEHVGDSDWYMIGPDEWVAKRWAARVLVNATPPQGVTGDRWIEVNLQEQTLAVYDHRQLVFATLIASGADPFWTRPGVFQIKQKLESTMMRGAFDAAGAGGYYLEDVPWTMYYDGPRALHGAYWRAKLGFPQSHGCVNLSVGDAHWLFDWANVGDWVFVWDPSGKTPTDPNLYSGGGY
jgi:hypothetical protein